MTTTITTEFAELTETIDATPQSGDIWHVSIEVTSCSWDTLLLCVLCG